MLTIRNALAFPPDNFFFFYASSASLPVNGDPWPSGQQLMIAAGGMETGDRRTDITYSAMPRFIAISPRKDWRFHLASYPAFGMAAAIAGTADTGWRIDGMIDKAVIWRAWKKWDEPALAQQLGVPLNRVDQMRKFESFEDFAQKIVIPLLPWRRKIIQAAWDALKNMPDAHWRGEYQVRNKWKIVDGAAGSGVEYHNWNSFPVWEKDGGIIWKKSKKLISLQGKFLCGATIRTLNREVMSVVEKLEAGVFAGDL